MPDERGRDCDGFGPAEQCLQCGAGCFACCQDADVHGLSLPKLVTLIPPVAASSFRLAMGMEGQLRQDGAVCLRRWVKTQLCGIKQGSDIQLYEKNSEIRGLE